MNPSVLYKYRAASELTEQIISTGQVWLSKADNLNDPLECKTGLIPEDWKERTIAAMQSAQFLGTISDFPGKVGYASTILSLSPRDTKRWINKTLKMPHALRIKAMRALYHQHGLTLSKPEDIFKQMALDLSEVGIFSLSERPDNELMWAHYGDSHKGLALGFSREEDNALGKPDSTIKVNYIDEKPVFKAGFRSAVEISGNMKGGAQSKSRVAFDDEVFRAALSTKTTPWAYEQEWRYIEPAAGLYKHPGRLTEIIYGYRMPLEARERYGELLSTSGYKAKEFEVIPKEGSSGFLLREFRAHA